MILSFSVQMASIWGTSCPTLIAWRGKKTSRKRLKPPGDRRQANGRATSTNYFSYSFVQFQFLTGGGQVPHSVGVCLRLPSLSLMIPYRLTAFYFQHSDWPCASYKLPPLALSLFSTFSFSCAFRTRSLQSFSNWNFSMVLIGKHAGCEATPETHFDARALRLPQENADACRKLVKH